jgi:hypothetical protein
MRALLLAAARRVECLAGCKMGPITLLPLAMVREPMRVFATGCCGEYTVWLDGAIIAAGLPDLPEHNQLGRNKTH